MAAIRRVQGTPVELGVFSASGSLARARGRAGVRELRVGRGAATLETLDGFPDLRILELTRTEAVDLAPLAATAVESLTLERVEGFDLPALAGVRTLRELDLIRTRELRFPDVLALPTSLETMGVVADRAEELARLLAAINWDALPNLRRLSIAADDLGSRADLSFIRRLQDLVALQVWSVHHAGTESSPLDPPYEGIPGQLRSLQLDAFDRAAARETLRAKFPDARVTVRPRELPPTGYDPSDDRWPVDSSHDDGTTTWGTYGSLCDLAAFEEFEIEYDAAQAAEAMIRATDPGLADRLDLDQEADGTGIAAPTREDLEAALRIVGATPRS